MMYAAVRLRGRVNVRKDMNDTMDMLNLRRVNHCVLLEDNPTVKGMLKKVENWITWGEIKKETEEKLKKKKGEVKVYRLPPPSHGLRSTKVHFPKGALGYRGDKINDLLERMI